jgi:aryl-alcohol dehydrogenase-like predicted oxidoreductase
VLEEMLKICDENGWQKPRYYQGSYSLITRGMETKLLPILRSAGMHFNGYQYVLLSSTRDGGIRQLMDLKTSRRGVSDWKVREQ